MDRKTLNVLKMESEKAFNEPDFVNKDFGSTLESISYLAGMYSSMITGGLCLLFFLATLSNVQLLYIFIKRPGLRSLSNQFIINLLVTNIAACWSIVPMLCYDSYLYDGEVRRVELSRSLACVIEGVTAGMCTASMFSVVLIAVDQYLAVVDPLRYHTLIRKRATWQIFTFTWGISFIVGALGVANSFYRSTYAVIYPIVFSLVIFFIPFVVICYIYICIYWAAHENSLRTQKNCSSSLFNDCSNSELRISHDSVLKDKGDIKFKNKKRPRIGHEPLSKKMKHESKPLLMAKDRKCKHVIAHKGNKVSKHNDLYPITSIEDIDLLTEKKSAPATPEKTLATLSDEQIIMKIDSRSNVDGVVSDSEQFDSHKNEVTSVSEPEAETSVKQPMFFVTKSNNSILKVNNNIKVSPLNRQLISNTIVTSLSKATAPNRKELGEKDSSSLPDQSVANPISSDQHNSSVISLSQGDDYSSLASSLRINESVVSLSSYNPSLSVASSVSDITLYNDHVVSYYISDELLSSFFCDKDFLSSLNVNKTDLSQKEELVTSLKGTDRYVRISLGCYNGIENVQVCNTKPDNVIDENTDCDKLSCKNSKLVGLRFSQECLEDSSQSETKVNDDKAAIVTESVDCVINDGLTSKACEKKVDRNEIRKSEQTESTSESQQMKIESQTNSNQIEDKDSCIVHDKRPLQCKGRMFKKNCCADDRRKQFYENERRKSNDSKCSSDDNMDCHFYRHSDVFHNHKEKTRSIDSVVSRTGVKSFHPSSTRSSLRSTSSTLVNSLKHRFSNASMFRYREESRTAKISFSIIVLALFSWLPFTILLLLHSPLFNFINYYQYSSFTFEKFAILCLSCHFVFSPLLFALRSKKIKREMMKMWRNMLCFFRKQDEEETRLRNSFYNDYHINKLRIKALKEKQRLENQMKAMHNVETMTSDHLLSAEPMPHAKETIIDMGDEENNNVAEKTCNFQERISFLSRLLTMKQNCCNSTKSWGRKCMKLAHAGAVDTQRSSISNHTVSTSTTDICNEV